MLTDWIDELAFGERKKTKPKTFSLFKKQAVLEALKDRQGPVRQVTEVGSSRCSLYKWKHEILPEKVGTPKKNPDARKTPLKAHKARKAELKAEIHQHKLRCYIMQGVVELLGKGKGTVSKERADEQREDAFDR
ncbi:MAG: hypothetical protein ACFNZW_05455 [Coriobacteriaceae bacterium]